MSEPYRFSQSDPAVAYRAGRRAGLAVAALALAVVAFVNALGIEKSLLAGVLAILALRGAPIGGAGRRMSWAAITIATVHLVTVAVVLILFHDKLGQLLRLLQKLS